MPILTFKDQSGYQIKVNSPDGSKPSESDLDGLFKQSYMARNKSDPSMQGGANAPALVKARGDVSKLQSQNQNLDTQSGIVQAAKNYSWPVSMMMQKGLGQKDSPDLQPTSGGSKMLADIGMIANPATGEALKAVGKAIGITSKTIGDIAKYAKPKSQIELAESVQNGLSQAKHKMIESYGKEYDRIIGNSDKKINITKPIQNFVEEGQSIKQNPDFAQQLAMKNPAAKKISDLIDTVSDKDNPVPEQLSAGEANNLSKSIRNLPGLKTKLSQASKYGFHTVQWTNEDRMLLGLADDIKGEVIDAHPELSSLNKDYGGFMNAYKRVAPDFKIGTTVSKLKNYSQLDPQKKRMFENIMPKSTIDKIKDFESADKMSQVLKKVGIGVASAAGLGAVGKEAWNLSGH